ncbi:MAG TPA: GNAT family N-acetyltransferase [Ktedonobacterales bacterium]|nr:GNAT family N-acetyltransferase [Ktedonobacterales bacterium]
MSIHLYPVNSELDYPRLAELLRTANDEPTVLCRLQSWRVAEREPRLRWHVVAVESGGRIAGFAEVERDADSSSGAFWIDIIVDPERRRQGIGAMLYDDVVAFAWEQGARCIGIEVRDDALEALRFVKQHGFCVERHIRVCASASGPFEDYYATTATAVATGVYVLVKNL